MPIKLLCLLEMFRVDIGFHISTIEGFIFFKVNDIKSDFLFAKVFDCEIEPLYMTSGIGINAHK